MLRGGAFKPRTSPYDFQGLRADGLKLLRIARRETGLPIVTELMSEHDLDLFEDVDIVQAAKNYYKDVFGIELTEAQVSSIFAPSVAGGSGFEYQ